MASGARWHAFRSAALTSPRFTGDANPVTNIDAGAAAGRFFLATGGETENTGTKLNAFVNLPPPGIELPVAALTPEFAAPPAQPAKADSKR